MYLFYFIYYLSRQIFVAITKLKATEQWGKSYLISLENEFKGKFDKDVIHKVSKFQSIHLHFVLNNYSGLYGRLNNKLEEEMNLQFLLMSVLYDALIDEEKIDEKKLNELFYNPEKANPSSFNQIVLIYIHTQLLNKVKDKEGYWNVLQQIHKAQKDSQLQFDPNTDSNTIIDITKRKGGYSLLMSRHYLMDPSDLRIDQCWYELGGLIQMTNDLFDTYKDAQSGIKTFANSSKSFNEIETIFYAQIKALKASIINLPFSHFKKWRFAINTSFIIAFGEIAINQIRRLATNTDSLPNFKDVNRKDLIIDMEKTVNKLRLIRFAFKNGKLWT